MLMNGVIVGIEYNDVTKSDQIIHFSDLTSEPILSQILILDSYHINCVPKYYKTPKIVFWGRNLVTVITNLMQ
jgi:hypothetical protein